MITKARGNARKVEATNVEFRLGEIEHLPVADDSVDVILSNCVINLSPDKSAVFHEAFRVLKPGGRLAISDVVAVKDMPTELVANVEAMTGCVSGSAKIAELELMLRKAGFQDVRIAARPESSAVIAQCLPGAEGYVTSAIIEGRKPGGTADCCGPACCA
jgi:SAM-dependent methyltransferase